jgi:lysyl-tRNA synthetase, class II
MKRLLGLDLGDIIGAMGRIFVTCRGEPGLRVGDYGLPAKSLRSPPDKHHGQRDVEAKSRRGELDLMADEDARELFLTPPHAVGPTVRSAGGGGWW